MRTLLIDGNYFANRCLALLNGQDKENNLQSDEECDLFHKALISELIKLWQPFSKYFDNFVIVADYKSWRKNVTFVPWYISKEEIESGEAHVGYKETREMRKKESPINYNNFIKVWYNFLKEYQDKINIIYIDGLEGDDVLKLITDKLNEEDVETLIYASDKDLIQLVHGNIFLYLNIKSKQHPDGCFVLSKDLYDKYISGGNDIIKKIMISYQDDIDFLDLLKINLYDDRVQCDRKLSQGMLIAEPYKIIFTKAVCGDKSDNILPIMRWKSKTGNVNYSVTEKIVDTALGDMLEHYSDRGCKSVMDNSDKMIDFFNNVIIETKQRTPIHNLKVAFDHNLKMVHLDPKYYPKESVKTFEEIYPSIELNLKKRIFPDDLNKIFGVSTAQINDKATDILKDSLPDDF